MEERLKRIEEKTDRCLEGLNKCASSVVLLKQHLDNQNQLSGQRMDQLQDLVETQNLVLNGNPRQDTKDRGLIGDVELLKDSAARKKKYYWMTIPVVITVLVSSFWNAIFGKDDHGRSEPTEAKANKTSPGPGNVWRHDRSRRE